MRVSRRRLMVSSLAGASALKFARWAFGETSSIEFDVSDSATDEIPQYLIEDDGVYSPTHANCNRELEQLWPVFEESRRQRAADGVTPIIRTGQWTNRDGVRLYTNPYGTGSKAGGELGVLDIEITDLVARWKTENRGAYLHSTSDWGVRVSGRLSANPPQLLIEASSGNITYSGGYISTIAPSTSKPANTQMRATISNSSFGLLHFRDITIPDDMTSATIRLNVVTSRGASTVTVNVYETDIPKLQIDGYGPLTYGLAMEVGEANLWGHPDVYDAGDFSPENAFYSRPAKKDQVWLTKPHNRTRITTDSFLRRGITGIEYGFFPDEDGTTYYMCSFVNGYGTDSLGPTGFSSNYTKPLEGDSELNVDPATVIDEMYARVYMMLEEPFVDSTDGIKLGLGFRMMMGIWQTSNGVWDHGAGSAQDVTDGRKAYKNGKAYYSGNSVRQHIGNCRASGTPYQKYRPMKIALSHLGPYSGGGVYGSEENIVFPGILLRKGTMHCIEAHIKLNTLSGEADSIGNRTANHDGVLEYWLDGRLAYRRTNFAWRRHSELSVCGYWINAYHGGSNPPAPGEVERFRLNSLVTAKRYIGPKASI